MGLLDDITLGRYEPRDSILHRLDPRVKLCGLPLLVVSAFAGQSPVRLTVLTLLAVVLIFLADIDWRLWWRGLWMLRWLFLFTLLLHLFFSPGRTLWGVGWLSRDGLLSGVIVCSQLTLAVLFSSLLTLTTSPRDVAGAVGAVLSPLARFGFPVREISTHLLLVLHFVPILREEASVLIERSLSDGVDLTHGSLVARGKALGRMTAPLLLRLVDRADALARSVAAGEDAFGSSVVLKPFWPPCLTDLIALGAGAVLLITLVVYLR